MIERARSSTLFAGILRPITAGKTDREIDNRWQQLEVNLAPDLDS